MLRVANYLCRQVRSVTAAATVAVGVKAATCVRNVRHGYFFLRKSLLVNSCRLLVIMALIVVLTSLSLAFLEAAWTPKFKD